MKRSVEMLITSAVLTSFSLTMEDDENTAEGAGGAGRRGGAEVRLPLWMLRCFGLWAPPGGAARAYAAYTAFVLASLLLGVVTFAGGVLLHISNTPVFSHIACLLGQCISCTFKSMDFLRQRRRVKELLEVMEALPQPQKGSEGAAKVRRAAREGVVVAIVYTAMGAVASVLWQGYPLMLGNRIASAHCLHRLLDDNLTESVANVTTAGQCVIRLLPTESWYPFDKSHGWGYAIAYIFQVEWVFYAYINTNTLDCLYVSLMLHAAAHGHALAERMRSARDERELRACVRYHQRLLDCVERLQGVVGPGALSQFMSSLGVICLALYNLTKVEDLVSKSQFGVFCLTMAGEVLLFCWYGEAVAASGEELERAVYASPWPQASVSTRRELVLVLARSQRPLRLRTAGGFKDLSRESYLKLIQTSYSLYTMLLSMEE